MVCSRPQTVFAKYIPPDKLATVVASVSEHGTTALMALGLYCLSIVAKKIAPDLPGMDDLMWIKATAMSPMCWESLHEISLNTVTAVEENLQLAQQEPIVVGPVQPHQTLCRAYVRR